MIVLFPAAIDIRQEAVPAHYGPYPAELPSVPRGRSAT